MILREGLPEQLIIMGSGLTWVDIDLPDRVARGMHYTRFHSSEEMGRMGRMGPIGRIRTLGWYKSLV